MHMWVWDLNIVWEHISMPLKPPSANRHGVKNNVDADSCSEQYMGKMNITADWHKYIWWINTTAAHIHVCVNALLQ